MSANTPKSKDTLKLPHSRSDWWLASEWKEKKVALTAEAEMRISRDRVHSMNVLSDIVMFPSNVPLFAFVNVWVLLIFA